MTSLVADALDRLWRYPILSSQIIPPSFYPTSPSGLAVVGLVQLGISTSVLGFTSSHSILRPALLPAITATVYILAARSYDLAPTFFVSNCIGGIVCGWWHQYVVSALIQHANVEDGGPSQTPRGAKELNGSSITKQPGQRKRVGKPGFFKRVLFGLNTINSQRNIGTPQEARHVPHFSNANPNYTPSRANFLGKTGLKIVVSYFIMDFLTSSTPDLSQNSRLFAPAFVPLLSRLGEVSMDEMKRRVMSSIGQWVGIYTVLQLVHSCLAFVTVSLGVYEPSGWRPLFGSVKDVYSIRNFWG